MKPSEHKTVQTRILKYAGDIGWTLVPREEAEKRRGFETGGDPRDRAKGLSLFFEGTLDAKVREFNPRYNDTYGTCLINNFISGTCSRRRIVQGIPDRKHREPPPAAGLLSFIEDLDPVTGLPTGSPVTETTGNVAYDVGGVASGSEPTVDTSGFVGMGTPTPGTPLEVKSSGADSDIIKVTRAADSTGIIEMSEDASGNGFLDLKDSTGATKARLAGTGNVGITGGVPTSRVK